MKYFFKVIIVLIVAAAVVFGMYTYTNGGIKSTADANLTTVSKPAVTEKNSNKVLIASLEAEDFYLYKCDNKAILNHNGKDYEFNNWSDMIDAKAPEMYYANFDSDSDNELVIKAVSSKDESSDDYIYELYVLNQITDENGNDAFTCTIANNEIWNRILSDSTNEEISQLKSCNKIVQFAMKGTKSAIKYDDNGIVTDGKAGYFRALQNDNGNYLTVSKWSRGAGIYSITKDNKIIVKVKVNVKYKSYTTLQQAGYIKLVLELDESNDFVLADNGISFVASSDYKVTNPKKTASSDWSYVEKNSDSSVYSTDTNIDWIKYDTNYDPTITTQVQNFGSDSTDIRNISKIEITNTYIALTAKEGCTFDVSTASKHEYSVIINSGSKNSYDIAYSPKLDRTGETEVLIIKFDKSYPQDEIESLTFNFGAK